MLPAAVTAHPNTCGGAVRWACPRSDGRAATGAGASCPLRAPDGWIGSWGIDSAPYAAHGHLDRAVSVS